MRKWRMPIPAPPDGGRAHPLAATTALFRQLHDELRGALADLTNEQLHWAPGGGANAIAVLVVHILGSEAETLESMAGRPVDRDRDAEFVEPSVTVPDLLLRLDEADQLLTRTERSGLDLGRVHALPTLPPGERRPAMTWLIANYGHAREHLGQLLLTKQLLLSP